MESIHRGGVDGNKETIRDLLKIDYYGPHIMPVKTRGNYKEFDFEGRPWNESEVYNAAMKAKEEGYDGLKMKNIIDSLSGKQTGTSYMVFDPKNIRSKFAKFDPAKSNYANILAGSALGTPTGRSRPGRRAAGRHLRPGGHRSAGLADRPVQSAVYVLHAARRPGLAAVRSEVAHRRTDAAVESADVDFQILVGPHKLALAKVAPRQPV